MQPPGLASSDFTPLPDPITQIRALIGSAIRFWTRWEQRGSSAFAFPEFVKREHQDGSSMSNSFRKVSEKAMTQTGVDQVATAAHNPPKPDVHWRYSYFSVGASRGAAL